MCCMLESLLSSIYQWRQQAEVPDRICHVDGCYSKQSEQVTSRASRTRAVLVFASLLLASSPLKCLVSMISICENKEERCSQGSSFFGGGFFGSSKSQLSGSFNEWTHSSCLALSWGGFMMLLSFFFSSCKSWHQHWGQLHNISVRSSKGREAQEHMRTEKKERLKWHLRTFLNDEISLRKVCGCMDRKVKVKNEHAIFCYNRL